MRKLTKCFLMILIALVFIWGVQNMQIAFGPLKALAGQQGDRVWTAMPPLATESLGTDGAGNNVRGVAFPYDNNSQPVMYAIAAVGNTAGDTVDIYGYLSSNTTYVTTTAAFCGGNTNYVHVNTNRIQQYGSVSSGASYFVLDDGAGNCGWGEFLDKAGTGTGDIITIHTSGGSNFAQGAIAGLPDLSGTTFASGSRVFPMFKIARYPIITADTIQKDSIDQGFVAATTGSPLLAVNADLTTGVTIFGVTVKYD